MGRLAKRIADPRLLGLIRRYLTAGILADGVVIERHEGTPQGGPLSPLLANVLLDEVDRELETRGHAFARYADDCNVYVQSRRAGEDVLQTLRRLYATLRLRINDAKSAVARPWDRPFLGYSFWVAPGRQVKRRVAPAALATMKAQVRALTARTRGCSLATVVAELRGYLLGWKAYFRLADTPGVFTALDQWLRCRLRMVHLKQWKRGTTTFRELRARGVSRLVAAQAASHTHRWWSTAHHAALHIALPTRHFDQLGVPRLGC
jgi:group II intron reverse transcriptase/maturase